MKYYPYLSLYSAITDSDIYITDVANALQSHHIKTDSLTQDSKLQRRIKNQILKTNIVPCSVNKAYMAYKYNTSKCVGNEQHGQKFVTVQLKFLTFILVTVN